MGRCVCCLYHTILIPVQAMDLLRGAHEAFSGDRRRNGPDEGACEPTGMWGLSIQAVMLVLATVAMIVKRRWEINPRPLKTWFFDTSKQGFAACVNHTANLLLSEYLGFLDHNQNVEGSDKCSWYLTTFLMDCLIGTYIVIILQGMIAQVVERRALSEWVSGEYGTPPRWGPYLRQLTAFITCTLFAKIVVGFLTMLPFMKYVGNSMWLCLQVVSFNSNNLKALMSLFIIPAVMNICIFWIIDGVLMKKLKKES